MVDVSGFIPDRIKEAVKQVQAAQEARRKAYDAYRALPEEADGFAICDKVKTLW